MLITKVAIFLLQIKQINTDKTFKEDIFVKVIFELEPKGLEEELYVCCGKEHFRII